jgi:hypothetical protein
MDTIKRDRSLCDGATHGRLPNTIGASVIASGNPIESKRRSAVT